MGLRDFRELKVWKKAHELTLAVYRATASYPKDEQYWLMSQTRRAAISIPANIAEGCGRPANSELARFLQIALGSVSELDHHLLLARNLGYLETARQQPLANQATEVKRMLIAFLQALQSKQPSTRGAPANGARAASDFRLPTSDL